MCSNAPNTQSMNFTHMFKFNDINGNLPRKCYSKNSIMDIINYHPDFTKFTYIVKLANMDQILNNIQANFTLFVPSDSSIKNLPNDIFINMDQGEARTIVQSLLLDYRIPSELLKDSPVAYFNTLSPQNRLFVTNINGNTNLNNKTNVIFFDIIAKNGIIHVIDKLIQPLQL